MWQWPAGAGWSWFVGDCVHLFLTQRLVISLWELEMGHSRSIYTTKLCRTWASLPLLLESWLLNIYCHTTVWSTLHKSTFCDAITWNNWGGWRSYLCVHNSTLSHKIYFLFIKCPQFQSGICCIFRICNQNYFLIPFRRLQYFQGMVLWL